MRELSGEKMEITETGGAELGSAHASPALSPDAGQYQTLQLSVYMLTKVSHVQLCVSYCIILFT